MGLARARARWAQKDKLEPPLSKMASQRGRVSVLITLLKGVKKQ